MHPKPGFDATNALRKASDEVTASKDAGELETALQRFEQQLQKTEIKEVNSLALNAVCNNVCAKLLITFLGTKLSASAGLVVQKMLDLCALPPIYHTLLSHIAMDSLETRLNLDPQGARSTLAKLGVDDLAALFDNKMQRLVQLDLKAIRSTNRNFGYSLLDMQGNFIWCDDKSQKVFELQGKNGDRQNLFNLMIPYSRRLLRSKFGGDLFADDPRIGSCKTFSYVIYSKTSMNQYLKCLKRMGIGSVPELRQKLTDAEEPNSIYHKYLRTLTSRATLIVLKFSRAEFKDLIQQKDYKIKVTGTITDLVRQIDEEEEAKMVVASARKVIEEEDRAKGRVDPFGLESENPEFGTDSARLELTDLKDQISQIDSLNQATSEVILVSAILLETRYSSSFPKFDYTSMVEDPVIRRYEEKIVKKIQRLG